MTQWLHILASAPEMMGDNTEFMKICRNNKIKSSWTEPHSPWQNKCENIIGVIMKKAKGQQVRRRIPKKIKLNKNTFVNVNLILHILLR